ncbi:MAG: NAD(P)H-hydrate dehydratase [Gemmatimonadetes bacterium]|nr:NAD(P)H-hydrate dehydratase [Gemmatimonadota bacterium]
MNPRLFVTTAEQARALDAATIAGGVASSELMARAGRAAAGVIHARWAASGNAHVVVFTGSGNNGGDGWVVAESLRAAGVPCEVVEVAVPTTDDAKAARASALAAGVPSSAPARIDPATFEPGNAPIIVDALLGTGARGGPRPEYETAIAAIEAARGAGAVVVSLDVPSGMDAGTGQTPGNCVIADATLTFGSIKRGLLRNRDCSGAITLLDIGLKGTTESLPFLVTLDDVRRWLPRIPAHAHKGTRRRVLVVGGAHGMAGAAILAARGALRSGAGMVRLCVAPESITAVQGAVPAAAALPWPTDAGAWASVLQWPHAVVLGPGVGLTPASRALVTQVLERWTGPLVLDADALTQFEKNGDALGAVLRGRRAIITPHAVEAERLLGSTASDIDAARFDATARLASVVHAAVLLKGVPTVLSDGRDTRVVARGTAALGTGGSGDVLAGMIAALITDARTPLHAGAAAAWVHGLAAEIAGGTAPVRVRGVTLDDIVDALAYAWPGDGQGAEASAPILTELPNIRW